MTRPRTLGDSDKQWTPLPSRAERSAVATAIGDRTAGAVAPPTFGTELRAALLRSGLTLDRVRHRLRQQGITISLSTLSYWQTGRSRPTGAASLKAVAALEGILDVPTGALRTRVGPPQPRGQLIRQDPADVRRTFEQGTAAMQALGEGFVNLNRDLRTLLLDVTVQLDAERTIRVISTRAVLRAINSGVDRLTFVSVDEEGGQAPPETVVRCGTLGDIRYFPHQRTTTVDILFGRTLERNDTVLIDYDCISDPSKGPSNRYQRYTRPGLHEFLLHIQYHPLSLPVSSRRYFRDTFDSEECDPRPLALDSSHSVHTLISRVPAGHHGIAWQWPD